MLALGAGCVLLLAGCWEPTAREVFGRILVLEGRCEIQQRGQQELRLLDLQITPGAGDILRTGPDGRLALAFLGNVLVEMGSETELEIAEVALAKDGNETGDPMRRRVARLRLLRGSLFVTHERRDVAAEPTLSVETAHGSLMSNYDCIFWIGVSPDASRVVCATGLVSFKSTTAPESVDVDQGASGQWSPEASKISPAEEDGATQDRLAKALEVASRLRQLRDRVRNVLPHVARKGFPALLAHL